MTLDEVISGSIIIVHPQRFAYLKADGLPNCDFFMISRDADEITVIAEESQVPKIPHFSENKWFALLEIRVALPFLAKGFLAKVTKTIAEADLNVLVVSTFSKDFILVRDESRTVATEALKAVGFSLRNEL